MWTTFTVALHQKIVRKRNVQHVNQIPRVSTVTLPRASDSCGFLLKGKTNYPFSSASGRPFREALHGWVFLGKWTDFQPARQLLYRIQTVEANIGMLTSSRYPRFDFTQLSTAAGLAECSASLWWLSSSFHDGRTLASYEKPTTCTVPKWPASAAARSEHMVWRIWVSLRSMWFF